MGLEPLEFADCLKDSPDFREKLHVHEKELDRMSKAIKSLITDGKELLSAAQNLAKTQRNFSKTLASFNLECIGSQKTDDEVVIVESLRKFSMLISRIEDERDRMLGHATEQFLKPLDTFRKQHIGSVKEGKKVFDKHTSKFCQSLERYLSLKTKINDNTLQEADADLDMERRGYYQASMEYVLILQEVQERKKFEFVEIILSFIYSWLTFYHEGHEVARDMKLYMTDLQLVLQNTRTSFESTRDEAKKLMLKMLDVRGSMGTLRGCTHEGYLFLMEKKALGTTWTKHYCFYKKEHREFFITPYNQVTGKLPSPEKLIITSCVRRASDSIEKRFCFDITVQDRPNPITIQALSEEDRKLWMDSMGGKEPVCIHCIIESLCFSGLLDDIGFKFISKCIETVETRGLHDQGLYRLVGVNSKVQKLLSMGLGKRKIDKLNLDDPAQFELKTITSAVKSYLRFLPEPLLTFRLHSDFISAAKQESKTLRIHDIHILVHKLPEPNFDMLDLLIKHLKRISDNADVNLMTVTNLGVCFGPTLMRPQEETVASIMDIKFCNIIVELLVTKYEMIFKNAPEGADISEVRVANRATGSPATRSGPNHVSTTPQTPGKNLNNSCVAQASPNITNSHHQHHHASSQVFHTPKESHFNPVYANLRSKLRPVDIPVYNPTTGALEMHAESSTSGSSDSLNSSQSSHQAANMSSSSIQMDTSKDYSSPAYANVNALVNKFHMNMGGSDIPTFGSVKRRTHCDSHIPSIMTESAPSLSLSGSLTGSLGSSGSPSSATKPVRRNARTLYHCTAENPSELSFEPNQIIFDIRPSHEPGWLEGSLESGVHGLIPQNYVEFLPK
ncbi:hypothetical protein ScPMuIL_011035 [Solemya velum]